MKRYCRIRRHEEDQLEIPALLHALSQLDPALEVIHLTHTSYFLEQDEIQKKRANITQKTLEEPRSQVP
jgi:hypothetical protein